MFLYWAPPGPVQNCGGLGSLFLQFEEKEARNAEVPIHRFTQI